VDCTADRKRFETVADEKLPPDEWTHLVKVGAMKPEWDDVIDVWTRNDPVYAHALLTRENYLDLLRRGEIERDAETGYPVYTGTQSLR
jgi:hypothetical protein